MTDTTVLLVVRNEEKYIGSTIESILSQTYRDFIFLIIDDGSTDKTWEIVNSFKDKQIRFHHFPEHQGLTKRLNWGLEKVKTQFVARMDSHNIAEKTRLEKQRDFMLEHPEVAVVGCNYNKITEAGETIFTSNFPATWEEIKTGIMKKNPFKHAAWFARYNVLEKEGFYNPNYRYAQDYELLLRLIPKYPVANLADRLLTEIYLPRSASQKHRLEQTFFVFKAQMAALKYYPKWQAIYLLRTLAFMLKICVWQVFV